MTFVNEIRNQRQIKGMTLRTLARELGISPSQMSKIESGKAKLTVSVALDVANILQVPASKFLAMGTPQATGRRTITRKATGGKQATPGMNFEALCSDFKENHNIYWNVTITALNLEEVGGWRQHPGQEFIYVLSGRLQLLSEFYDPVILEAGDSILFDSEQRHAYIAPDGPANLLMINSVF